MKSSEILIHIHPELSAQDRARVVQGVGESVGVISAQFDKHKHPHALIVDFNPDAVEPRQILEAARRHDPEATLVY